MTSVQAVGDIELQGVWILTIVRAGSRWLVWGMSLDYCPPASRFSSTNHALPELRFCGSRLPLSSCFSVTRSLRGVCCERRCFAPTNRSGKQLTPYRVRIQLDIEDAGGDPDVVKYVFATSADSVHDSADARRDLRRVVKAAKVEGPPGDCSWPVFVTCAEPPKSSSFGRQSLEPLAGWLVV